jgi:mannosylglycerate hydrolase MGH1-like protein
MADAERQRLAEDDRREQNWKRWGPYLSERQWGTVREDYSEHGTAWDSFPHDHARSRAYRWGEDGLLGVTDREGRLCFALALWNGRDPILKERLFGLSGPEGNHGEDVKEIYHYLDSTPTHSYMKALYKYPQAEFPYARLVEENRRRGTGEPEFELVDTGVFDDSRYWDVIAEYAKASPDDLLVRITVANRGPDAAELHVLPTLWFRNTWSWGRTGEGYWPRPGIRQAPGGVSARHESLGEFRLAADDGPEGPPRWLHTENETNAERLFGAKNATPHVKDAFHEAVVHGRADAVNPAGEGTRAAAWYRVRVPGGESRTLRLRLRASGHPAPPAPGAGEPFGDTFERVFATRIREADEFYDGVHGSALRAEERAVSRQAYAGLLWSKQFYHYIVKDWLEGDPAQPAPPEARRRGRNAEWTHAYNRDVISMPDKWEYPWFAAWDLAFHMVPFAKIDPEFAKSQLLLFLREWYMHPNGQIPAYEWAFGDVNPPVHAWAVWRVYKLTGEKGRRDRLFLERAFQKLLINFTWWVNRKDPDGMNIFAGGFLGLDNVGVFDRSRPLPTGGHLEQADGTAWMAFYCSTMLAMAIELAVGDPAYEDVASKFLEHFVAIAEAMNTLGGTGLWNEDDGFYYDQLHVDGQHIPMRLRSCVGVVPLFACEVLEQGDLDRLPGVKKRLEWFVRNLPQQARNIGYMEAGEPGHANHRMLSIPSRERLERVLRVLFDEREFFGAHGVRALSAAYRDTPYVFHADGMDHVVRYTPAESDSGLFGGNSNWRGPVWFPVNYLLVEALERYHHFYGDTLTVEVPAGSGQRMNLRDAARELAARLVSTFLPDANGRRPCHGDDARYARDPHWRDLVLFHEYFHGDDGRGVGASHQTGWTALAIRCIEKSAAARKERGRKHAGEDRPALASVRS